MTSSTRKDHSETGRSEIWSKGSKFFSFKVDSFLEGIQIYFDLVAFPGSAFIPLIEVFRVKKKKKIEQNDYYP